MNESAPKSYDGEVSYSQLSSPHMAGRLGTQSSIDRKQSPSSHDAPSYERSFFGAAQGYSYTPPSAITSGQQDTPNSSDPRSRVVVIQKPKPQCWEYGCNGREFSTYSDLLRHQRGNLEMITGLYCSKCGADLTRIEARVAHIVAGECPRGLKGGSSQPSSRSVMDTVRSDIPPQSIKGRTNTRWIQAEEQRMKVMRDAGSSWSEIAKTFPTRTEGSVKKHWYKDMRPIKFHPVRNTTGDTGQAMERATILPQTSSQYIDMTDHEITDGPEVNREYEQPTGPADSSFNNLDLFHEIDPLASSTTSADAVEDNAGSSRSRIHDTKLPHLTSTTQIDSRIFRRSLSPMDHKDDDQQLFDLMWIRGSNPHQSENEEMMRKVRKKVMDHYLVEDRCSPISTDARVRHMVRRSKPSAAPEMRKKSCQSGTQSLPRNYHDSDSESSQPHCVNKEPHQTATEPGKSRFSDGNSSNTHNNSSAADIDQLRGSELRRHTEATWQKLADFQRDNQKTEQFTDPSHRALSRISSDTESMASSGESVEDFDDLFLDTEVSRLRAWLFERSGSEHFCKHLQRRLAYGRCQSSTPQKQSKDSTARSNSSNYSSSTSSTATVSCGSAHDGKRNFDNGSGQEEQQRKKRSAQDEPEDKPAPRLACLFNKYDPMMYRSNAQTNKKFEICGLHEFQNMNKLYEHLKRVHSDQPLQCPRCTHTNFGSSEHLQAHQTTSEPCVLVPLDSVKRIQWITHDKRKALQAAVNRRLRSCTDEEKWRYAYRWLFHEAQPGVTPCPYLQDPVVSIVSSVVDDFEIRLGRLISSSADLNHLESRLSSIRGQFLAQYGITMNEVEQDPPSLTRLRIVSSSPGSGRLTATMPSDMPNLNQPHLEGDINHDQSTLSNSQSNLNRLPPGFHVHQDTPLEPHVLNDPVCLHHDDFPDSDDISGWDLSTWNLDYDTTNDISNSLHVTENPKDLHGYGPLMQKESLNLS